MAVTFLGPSSLAPHPVAAQQVGVFAVGAASDQEGYRRPAGAGVSVAFRPLSWISVRLDAARFAPDDVLLLGSESRGVPPLVHDRASLRLRIPQVAGTRSLNIAVAAGIALAEGLRQTEGWPE